MINRTNFFFLFITISFSFGQIFFSEYAEGSSNHKYLEIYNGTGQAIDLSNYAFPNSTNGADTEGTYDYWNTFDAGATVVAGDVYVICHGAADDFIQAECDQTHTYLSNGDDGFCLVEGSEESFSILDCIGTWSSTDPGDGWDVAGISDATKEHTLVRKPEVSTGNLGNWNLSAGTNLDDSEWEVYDQNTWDYLGYHEIDTSGNIYGCMDPSACNYNPDVTVDNGSCAAEDCMGECAGSAVVDDCGVCGGENASMDCAGVCGGDSIVDECGVCNGDGTGCEGEAIFFSEYAEGSSNNKYLEIYNGTDQTIDLGGYAFPNANNGADIDGIYDYWNSFDAGSTVAPGDVFVICHPSADDQIQADCNQHHTYLSNGDDGFCLVSGTEDSFTIIDCIGTWSSEDPGNGWDVAGISDATKDHTLVRKAEVLVGNFGNWNLSAGTNAENSQWVVFDQNTWDYLGSHPNDFDNIGGCTDSEAENYNPNATIDDGSCQYAFILTIEDIQGEDVESPFVDYIVTTSGIVTGISYSGFFIQDGVGPWSGIWIYQSSPSVLVGDMVETTGMVAEYNGLTEIEASSVSVLSSGNTLPSPVLIETSNLTEAYESVRIEFFDAECTSLPNDYGEWQVDNIATIDDRLSDLELALVLGQGYNIVGVVDCYSTFKVQATEIVPYYEEGENIPPVAILSTTNSGFSDYGETVVLSGLDSYDPDPDGFVIGYAWIQESGFPVSFGDYEEPEISFVTPNEYTTLVFSLQVIDNEGLESSLVYFSVIVGQPSIYDIQYTEDIGDGFDCYPSTSVGQELSLTGIVTAVKDFSSYPNFYIQQEGVDSYAGIYVYVPSGFDDMVVGDNLTVTGIVTEEFGITRLDPTSDNTIPYVIHSSGNYIQPLEVSTSGLGLGDGCTLEGEGLESMFIKIENITLNSIDEYGVWNVSDENGNNYLVDDYFFNNDLGDFPSLIVGTEILSVTGVLGHYFDYKIYPRNINDIEGLDGGGGNEYQVTSISDIQNFSDIGSGDDCYPSLLSDSYVDVTGIVTAAKPDSSHFFIQDSTGAGVYVYNPANYAIVSVGDEINIHAQVDDYYGLTELKNVNSYNIISNDNDIYVTNVLTGNLGLNCNESGELFEGMIVSVSNVTVDSINVEYNSVYINDGSGTAKIDDYIFDDLSSFPILQIGTELSSITGVVHYYFGEYVIYPRDEHDIMISEDECISTGDINDDSIVNILDIIQLVNAITGSSELTEAQSCQADLNQDSIINILDIISLVNIIIND